MGELDIRIEGQSVDLLPEATLGLKLSNPHFDFERISSPTATLPGFPLTRTNQRIFGYWEQPQTGAMLGRRRLEHYYNGQLMQEGQFVLTEAGPGGYNGQFVQALGEFFGDWQNRPLSDLPLGTLPMPGVVPATGLTDSGQTAVVFPTILNPDFFGTNGAGISYGGRMNPFTGGAYQPGNGPLVPMMLLRWLLGRIALATNTIIDGAFLTHPAYSQLLLYNTRALDGANAVTLNRHLPDLTVAELVLELRKLFCLQLDIDPVNRRLTLGFFQTALAGGNVLDWSTKLGGGIQKTPETNTRLRLASDLDSGDAGMKDKPAALAGYDSAGTGGFATVKSRFSTLLMDAGTGLPRTAQPGVTAQFGQAGNTFGPRLLFWNPTSGTPAATNLLNGFGLFWGGAGGLALNHWAEMEAMRRGQFWVKAPLNLTETDLAGLRWHRKVYVAGVTYFVISVDVTLPIRKPATVLLLAA